MDETNLEIGRDEMLRRWAVAEERIKSLEAEQRRRGDAARELSEAQAENAILKGQLEKLSSEVALKNEQINELFKKWQNGNITFLLKENGELSKKWRFAEDRAEDARQAQAAAENALAEKERQRLTARQEVHEKENQIALLFRKLEELKSENHRLEAELQGIHSEGVGRLEEKIKEISQLRTSHEKQEQKIRQEMQEMETGYQEKDIELQKLGLQFGQIKMQFQKEFARLQDENRALKERLGETEPETSVRFNPEPADSAEIPAAAAPAAGKKILLVESNPESVTMISNVLIEAGFEVFTANSAEQIAAACGHQTVDVLLMNIVMDDIDVYALTHQLVQDSSSKTVPIILMSSNPQLTEIFKQEGSAAVRSYLYKPFSREELLATLDFVLAGRG